MSDIVVCSCALFLNVTFVSHFCIVAAMMYDSCMSFENFLVLHAVVQTRQEISIS